MTPSPRVFHGLAGDVVRSLEPFHEADPVAVLVSYLTMFGAYCGTSPYVSTGGDDHPARLNTLLVGRSAKARKGTSLAVSRLVFDKLDPTWATHRVLGGMASGEALIAQVADRDENTPRLDKRLMVVESEFGRLLAVASRQGSIVSAVIRQAWDSGRLANVTKSDPQVVRGAHVCILGHITADELRQKLPDVDVANGFLNRFLLVHVGRHKRLASADPVPEQVLDRLATATQAAAVAARRAGRYSRTPDAERLWQIVYDTLGDDEPTGPLGDALARAETQVLRLSIAYAALDGAPAIDVDHVAAAYELWRVSRSAAAGLFRTALPDPDRRKLLEALESAGDAGLTRTQVSAIFNRNKSRPELDALVAVLTSAGLAHESSQRIGQGPPTRLLRVTDAGTKYEFDELDELDDPLPDADSLISSISLFVATSEPRTERATA